MRPLPIAAAFLIMASAPLAAQQQFTLGSSKVTVGVLSANSGNGYSVYHYSSETGPNSVKVTCTCTGEAKPRTHFATCAKVLYQCSCPSAKLVCD